MVILGRTVLSTWRTPTQLFPGSHGGIFIKTNLFYGTDYKRQTPFLNQSICEIYAI
jgi:hypothetical protein